MDERRVKQLGQYFTPAFVADFMVAMADVSKDGQILEPAAGLGVFVESLQRHGYSNIDAFEVDESLKAPDGLKIRHASFVSAAIAQRYDLIIGNPPYVRWKNLSDEQKSELFDNRLWLQYCNSLCDYLYIFILKSIELLKDDGQLIFITPEYWINTMHAQKLRDYIVQRGYFSELIHFSETPIFNKVASSILIFKFVKHTAARPPIKITKYNSTKKLMAADLDQIQLTGDRAEHFTRRQFKKGESWVLAPDNVLRRIKAYETKCQVVYGQSLFGQEKKYYTLGDLADIGNGLVSGLDKAFQIPDDLTLNRVETKASLNVLKARRIDQYVHGQTNRYIFVPEVNDETELSQNYPNFYKLLQPHKADLAMRYQYGRQIDYWQWVFPRSLQLFQRRQPRIFVPCKERISHKRHFRFTHVQPDIYPTQDVTAILLKPETKESIYYILALLNSQQVFEWLRYKGVVKGNIVEFSERPLASIPIRVIDWSKPDEVELHDEISNMCRQYIERPNSETLAKLQKLV